MYGTLTVLLVSQHEELPEYVNVGFFCKNSYKDTTVMIQADRRNLVGVVSSHSDSVESVMLLAGCLPK